MKDPIPRHCRLLTMMLHLYSRYLVHYRRTFHTLGVQERERELTLFKVLKGPEHPLWGPARWLRPCGDWESELASHLLGLLDGLVLKGPVGAPEVVDPVVLGGRRPEASV